MKEPPPSPGAAGPSATPPGKRNPNDAGRFYGLSVGYQATGGGSPSAGRPGDVDGAADETVRALPPGAVLADRYEVCSLLGQGGMGVVYRVLDRVRGAEVALKVLLPSLLARANALERFRNEAEVALRLTHENIVRVYDVNEDRATGLRFFTMELLDGVSLRQWLEEKKKFGVDVAPGEALEIARQLLEALRYAHGTTIHRDLKPENIFVLAGDPLRVKVLDFGIAKLRTASQLTATSTALGTAYYMAPEQQLDAAKVDARADLYSVCVILYELLTGELPVGAFRKASDERKGLPPSLDELILRGLQRRPDGRPASADALLEEVRAIRGLLARGTAAAPGRRRLARVAVVASLLALALLAGAATIHARRAGWLSGGEHRAAANEPGPAARPSPGDVELERAAAAPTTAAPAAPPADPVAPPPSPAPAPALAVLDLEPRSPAILPGYAIAIKGRLSEAGAGPVDVGGLKQPVDERGRFEVHLGLRPGEKEVIIRGGTPPRELARIAFEVDETSPAVTLVRPGEGLISAGGPIDVEARIEDAHAPGEVTLRLEVDGRALGTPIRLRCEDGVARGRIELPASDSTPAATLILEATDAAGRVGSARRAIPIDRAPPRIAIEAPAEGLATTGTAVTLALRVEDDHAADEVVVSWTEAAGAAAEQRLPLARGRHDGRLDLPPAEGPIHLAFRATDRAGNVGRARVAVLVDRTPPRLTVEPAGELVPDAGRVSVTVGAGEPLASLEVGGVQQVPGAGPASGPFRVTVPFDTAGGTLAIVARDAAGNEARAGATVRRAAEVTGRDDMPADVLCEWGSWQLARTGNHLTVWWAADPATAFQMIDGSCGWWIFSRGGSGMKIEPWGDDGGWMSFYRSPWKDLVGRAATPVATADWNIPAGYGGIQVRAGPDRLTISIGQGTGGMPVTFTLRKGTRAIEVLTDRNETKTFR